MSKEIYLEINIDTKAPVDLIELTEGLYAFAAFYKRFAKSVNTEGETRLLVDKVEHGSILAKLITSMEQYPMFEDSKMLKFVEKLDGIIDGFVEGKTPKRGEVIKERTSYGEIKTLLNLACNNKGAEISWGIFVGGKLKTKKRIKYNEANIINNRITKYLDESDDPVLGTQTKETFYWFQARGDSIKTGNKGIIQRITRKPLPVVFDPDSIRNTMMDAPLFKKGYIVDVEVGYIGDEPSNYKIKFIHETFDRPATKDNNE